MSGQLPPLLPPPSTHKRSAFPRSSLADTQRAGGSVGRAESRGHHWRFFGAISGKGGGQRRPGGRPAGTLGRGERSTFTADAAAHVSGRRDVPLLRAANVPTSRRGWAEVRRSHRKSACLPSSCLLSPSSFSSSEISGWSSAPVRLQHHLCLLPVRWHRHHFLPPP